jgi:hypothetical protein
VVGDDAGLFWSHPAFPAAPASDPSTPDDPAHDDPVVAIRSADDSDVGWGDRDRASNDDRLHQDKPPHW